MLVDPDKEGDENPTFLSLTDIPDVDTNDGDDLLMGKRPTERDDVKETTAEDEPIFLLETVIAEVDERTGLALLISIPLPLYDSSGKTIAVLSYTGALTDGLAPY
jgi:hypothetical protein